MFFTGLAEVHANHFDVMCAYADLQSFEMERIKRNKHKQNKLEAIH